MTPNNDLSIIIFNFPELNFVIEFPAGKHKITHSKYFVSEIVYAEVISYCITNLY